VDETWIHIPPSNATNRGWAVRSTTITDPEFDKVIWRKRLDHEVYIYCGANGLNLALTSFIKPTQDKP